MKIVTVAENINVMSKTIGPAMKAKEKGPIQKFAVALTERGADLLDLNLGPARKAGDEMMTWLVQTVQEVTDLPLFLDTTNADAVIAGVKAYRPKKGKCVINSISTITEKMDKLLPAVKEFDCHAVALMYGLDGIPRDANERGILASEMMVKAEEHGVPLTSLWFDPIVVPVSSQQLQLQSCVEFMMMLQEIAPGALSTCGLSNVSNGSPEELRPILNRVFLTILGKYGIHSAIVDGFDKDMMDLCQGKRDDLVEGIVWPIMDGVEVSTAGKTKEQIDWIKTTKLLLGQTLYSASWLEL